MNNKRPGFPARTATVSQNQIPAGASVTSPGALPPSASPLPVTPTRHTSSKTSGNTPALRERMVQKLHEQGINTAAVLQAMGRVERHHFVDDALVNQAYEDTSLPIGLGQTISKPSVVARMAQLLLAAPLAQQTTLARVLEIGTGCGYQAAILSLLVREVYSIERLRALHEKARDNLRPYRLPNVHLLFGDGIHGYAPGAPYAGIIAAASGSAVPPAWYEQLAEGGRLVTPHTLPNQQQVLLVIDRTPQGFVQTIYEPVHFVPLQSGTS